MQDRGRDALHFANEYNTWNELITAAVADNANCVCYMYGGAERGDQGTAHSHWVVHLSRPQRRNYVKRFIFELLGVQPNIWQQLGSNKQAKDYVNKQDDTYVAGPFEAGEMKTQGGSRLAVATQILVDGGSVRDVMSELPSAIVVHAPGLQTLSRMLHPAVDVPDRIIKWYVGPSGTGKTWAAMAQAATVSGGPVARLTMPPDTRQPFYCDAYDPATHNAVVFDELRPGSINYTILLALFDTVAYEAHTRYTATPWNPKYIYVTSPFHPRAFAPAGEQSIQLERRIDTIHTFTTVVCPRARALMGLVPFAAEAIPPIIALALQPNAQPAGAAPLV